MAEQWLIELPEGYTLVDFAVGLAAITAKRISDANATIGAMWWNDAVKLTRYTPPAPVPIPDPTPTPTVVYYECKITKLNIRLLPDADSDDKGDIFKGEKVGVVAVVTEGNEVWGRLESGYYAAISIGANVYLEKVTTGG